MLDKAYKKILIIRLGAIGDVVHTTVIAQAIKSKYPNSQIHLLTQDIIAPLVQLSPYIDEILEFNNKKRNNIFYLLKICLTLFSQRYDVVFNLTNSLRNILMAYSAMPKRVVKRRKIYEHAVSAFFETAHDIFPELEQPKTLKLNISDELKRKHSCLVDNYPKPYFVLNPGGANNNDRQGRIWDNEKWLELGSEIITRYGGTVFVCGSKNEASKHEVFQKLQNCIVYSGKLSLLESSVLYSFADIFISGDSGPLHIADALGVKSIALMGSTSPKNCGPYSQIENCIEPKTECKYCGQKKCKLLKPNEKITPCINSISVADVLKKIENLYATKQ